MGVGDAAAMLGRLKTAFKPPNADLAECGRLLSELKVLLLTTAFMPIQADQPPLKELLVAREVLEIGARWSIAMEQEESFERYYLQLQTYYTDFESVLPTSVFRCEMIGLNLLHLLCMNRIAEFHMALERISTADMADVYIKHAIQLERFLMEGSYNKIIVAKDNVPSPLYEFFVGILINTIRAEIVDCSERAFSSIAVEDAQRLLFLEGDTAAFEALVSERGWTNTNGSFVFPDRSDHKANVPRQTLIENSLKYAVELERIV